MSKLAWDQTGERFYETGVKKGVVYPQANGAYPAGYAWNGLTAVTESPSGAEANPLYADDIKYLNLLSKEEFGATVEAYTYPDEFAECDGSAEIADGVTIGQQPRKAFGMCYRTTVGNDESDEYGYKLHCIYGAKAAPSEKAYTTVNESPDGVTFSWELTTTPVEVTGKKPTASLTIDSTKVDEDALAELEDILYGVDAPEFSAAKTYAVGDYVMHAETEGTAKLYKCKTAISEPGQWDSSKWNEITNPGPRLPLPDEIATIFAAG